MEAEKSATRSIETPAPPPQRRSTVKLSYRPDIEGLRAVAIGLVLVYHAGLPWLPGGFVGVDIFFVISGFLITGVMLREVAETGRLSLVGFYARRAKRLLPATVLVLVTTAVLTVVFLPISQRSIFGGDIAAAAGYVVNWRLADRAVDYLAEDTGASPVQHFWSLAVEEQFYVLWPVLVVLLLLAARRLSPGRGARHRTLLLSGGLVAIVVPSFLWATHLTATSPSVSFFVTTTRLWELGIGAGVALALGLLARLPRRAAVTLGGAGLVAVVAPAFFFDSTTLWPGSATLLPVLGTAAVIAAGVSRHGTPVERLLSWRPAVWIGGLSYSLYLWHWPMLVIATAHHGGDLGAKRGLLVVALSLVPAWLSYKLVEHPVRSSRTLARRPGLTLSIGLNCTVVGILAGVVLMVPPARPAAPVDPSSALGASVLLSPDADLEAIVSATSAQSISPDPLLAVDDAPQLHTDGCQMTFDVATAKVCSYGDPAAGKTMFMVGDSKMAQWQPALEQYADENGYSLQTLIKSSCTLSPAMLYKNDAPFSTCHEWGAEATQILLDEKPDLVVYSGGASSAMNDPADASAGVSSDVLVDGIAETWRELVDQGSKVVVLLDNPSPGRLAPVYECVLENTEALDRCSFPLDEGDRGSAAPVQRAAADLVPEVGVLDLTDVLCPLGTCPAVIGDTLVYRQGSHLTTSYVASASAQLSTRLDALLAG